MTLSEKIFNFLDNSANKEAPLTEILKATNVPKRTLNAELQKLKRHGVISNTLESPPVWAVKDSTKMFSFGTHNQMRMTRSRAKAHGGSHVLAGKKKGKKAGAHQKVYI